MNNWHIAVPICFIVGALLISLSCWYEHRRDRRWRRPRINGPASDHRDWYGAFMKDCRENPRSWR